MNRAIQYRQFGGPSVLEMVEGLGLGSDLFLCDGTAFSQRRYHFGAALADLRYGSYSSFGGAGFARR